jgi:NADH-quinone oxidoreductase subunit M
MFKVTPVLGGMLLLAGLTTLSLPGTNSFISEFLVLIGSYGREPAFTIIATVGMIMAAIYVLWFYQRVMHGPVRGNALLGAMPGPGTMTDPELGVRQAIPDLDGREKAILIPLIVLILGIGLYPKPVLDVITPSVKATMSSIGLSDPVGGK